MKFAKGQYINEQNETCVVGALALSQGLTQKQVRNSDRGADKVMLTLSRKLGLTEDVLDSLITLNDNGRWQRLETKLKKLRLFKLVEKYALPSKATANV